MKSEVEALARHRLSRAREAFAEGDHLLVKGALMGAVNRFYYAAFYAARALLATREVDSSRHTGVISLFQKHFVKTGLVLPDKAQALPRSFEKRQNALERARPHWKPDGLARFASSSRRSAWKSNA